MGFNIIIICIALISITVFTGIKISYLFLNKVKVEFDKMQDIFIAKIFSFLNKNHNQFLTTISLCNILTIVFIAINIFRLTAKFSEFNELNPVLTILIQIFISTLLILFFEELLPKIIFRPNPNSSSRFFSILSLLVFLLFFPITKLMMLLSVFFSKTLNKRKNAAIFLGESDFESFNSENQNEINQKNEIEQELKIFKNALSFSKVKLRECIIPRNELVAVDVETPITELSKIFAESGYSKILIFKETIDNIIGYVHLLEMFKKPDKIETILSSLLIVPETMSANKLLDILIKEHKSIALVVDEFGGTAGIATTEDLMEEIFGEIEDEHDTTDYEDVQISDNEFLFSGRIEIDYINEKYNIGIPVSDDYETVAGYILFHHQTIPNVNDEIEIDIYKFFIVKMEKPRIESVRLIINT